MLIKDNIMKTVFAINNSGEEICSNTDLYRREGGYWSVLTEKEEMDWCCEELGDPDDVITVLPKGSIKKITGKEISWKDEPIEIEI